jgi:hypothetical protein
VAAVSGFALYFAIGGLVVLVIAWGWYVLEFGPWNDP